MQAQASGTATHFLIKIAANMANASIGFGVWTGSSNADTAPGTLLIYGVYDSFTFSSGAGWYAIPFTSASTLAITSGTWYDLAFYESTEASIFCRANNDSPFPSKWGPTVSHLYNDPPQSADWNLHFANTSAPWIMGLLATEESPPTSATGCTISGGTLQ
jgi:hypothetical protein